MSLAALFCVAACAIAAVLGLARPAAAEGARLDLCTGDSYPFKVTDLLIEVSDSKDLPDNFDLKLEIPDYGTAEPRLRRSVNRDLWDAQSLPGFKLQQVALRPQVGGFVLDGPQRCEYQILDAKKRCAAWYFFRARQMKLALHTDPPNIAVRLQRGAAPVRAPDPRCPRRAAADHKLEAAVQAKLAAEAALAAFVIEVGARNGTVALAGLVDSDAARRKALDLAAQTPGVRKVDDNLKVEPLCDGSALLEVGGRKITIERVQGATVLFSATVDVPADFPGSRPELNVTRKMLQDTQARPFAASEATSRGRTAGIMRKTSDDLGNLKVITIKRSEW